MDRRIHLKFGTAHLLHTANAFYFCGCHYCTCIAIVMLGMSPDLCILLQVSMSGSSQSFD